MGLKQDLKKLYDDLDYWIFIGIGDDIVKCKEQRPEYKHLVEHCMTKRLSYSKIPRIVRFILYKELSKPILLSKTIWMIILLKSKYKLNDIITTCRGKL